MPSIRLTQARRIEIETRRVRGVIEVALLSGPINQNDLAELIDNRGIKLSGVDLLAIRAVLIADGTIEIV